MPSSGGRPVSAIPNAYSELWRTVFGAEPVPPERLEAEVAFVARQMPLPAFRRVLDLCCGSGRHARRLAARGHDLVGADLSASVLAGAARRAGTRESYACMDMHRLALRPGGFDGVLVLWQSFGYLGDAENAAALGAIARTLRPGGRVILDIYHPGFFEANAGTRTFVRAGRVVTETKVMSGNRLTVRLHYDGADEGDVFSWRLYTPDEAASLGAAAGLTLLLACADFDEREPPTAALPRMQLVFTRAGADPDLTAR